MMIECKYTGIEIDIQTVPSSRAMPATGWGRMSLAGRELYVVQVCVFNWKKLMKGLDYFWVHSPIANRPEPRDYMTYLCSEVLKVNPHLREAVYGPNAQNACAEQPKKAPLAEKTLEVLVRELMDGDGGKRPLDHYTYSMGIFYLCARQDKTNELLERLISLMTDEEPL